MDAILLRFVVRLERHDLALPREHYGPLFRKWLPNGKPDALVLGTEAANMELRVWFERRGFTQDSFIEFSLTRREVDPRIMRRQAVLDAGPLFGQLMIWSPSRAEVRGIQANAGSLSHVALGKKVVKLIHPPVSNFIETLRTHYGQYWIAPFESWDSRRESLGSYYSRLQLDWSLDDGASWHEFRPNENVQGPIVIVMHGFEEYLSRNDWQALRDLSSARYQPSLAAAILASAHELLDNGSLKHALIEGVSALELAIGELIRRGDPALAAFALQSWNKLRMGLRDQVVLLAALRGTPSAGDVQDTLDVIDLRNKVVHEGYDPTEHPSAEAKAGILLKAVGALLPGPPFRFPTGNPGNELESSEEADLEELSSGRRCRQPRV